VTQEEQKLDPQEEEERDTRETEALAAQPVQFEPAQVEAVGDPAAASVDAEAGEPLATGGESPIEADARGAEQAESPPIAAIVGAFVGAFVAAKLIGRLGGGND
jgi:hypothetical protein